MALLGSSIRCNPQQRVFRLNTIWCRAKHDIGYYVITVYNMDTSWLVHISLLMSGINIAAFENLSLSLLCSVSVLEFICYLSRKSQDTNHWH